MFNLVCLQLRRERDKKIGVAMHHKVGSAILAKFLDIQIQDDCVNVHWRLLYKVTSCY